MECELLKELEPLKTGTHLASIYKNKKEQFASVVPFIMCGLKNNEKCIYITDENTKEEIIKMFNNVDAYIDSHQLEFFTSKDIYLKNGFFDPDSMIALLRDHEKEALKKG